MRTVPLRRSMTALALAALAVCSALGLAPRRARAEHLRDLAEVAGARDNQLLGYGVVTGLSGTGDDTGVPFTNQSVLSMLRRLGVQIDPQQMRLRNVAAVIVTATIPPFARPGARLDVTVSSVGNARSLSGGVLVQTVLRGADQQPYAVAQGSLVVGNFEARGASGTSVRTGSTLTTARIAEGALVERVIPTTLVTDNTLTLQLRTAGFTVAARIVAAINQRFGANTATARDGGTVAVRVPTQFATDTVGLVAAIEDLDVTPVRRARVVINERTGTIVAGGDVRLSPVVVVHGGLTIVVRETPVASQPVAPAGGGTTVVTPNSDVTAHEPARPVLYVPGAPTLSDVATALSTLGLPPRELASVLQALREAGALEAEVVVQ